MRSILMAAVLLAPTAVFAAPTITTFDVPGAASTIGGGFSPSGIVAGSYTPAGSDACGASCGYLRTPAGTFTTFSVFGADFVSVTAVNDAGTVVGVYQKNGLLHGFIRTPDGTLTRVRPHAFFSDVEDINDSGTAIGFLSTSKGTDKAFVRSPSGAVARFADENCRKSEARRINATGAIVGNCGRQHHAGSPAFVRAADGTMSVFAVPGAVKTWGNAIGDDGVVAGNASTSDSIVGYTRDTDGTLHTFVVGPSFFDVRVMATVAGDRQLAGGVADEHTHYLGYIRHQDGTLETFDPSSGGLSGTGTTVNGLNASGAVAGSYSDDGTTFHGFIRTP